MGKKLIIKGADFSENRISGHNYITFERLAPSQGGSQGVYRACHVAAIPAGATIGVVDAAIYENYKFAVNIGTGTWPPATQADDALVKWDTAYTGSSYIQQNITVGTAAIEIMVAPADGSALTEAQLAELNAQAFYID